MINWKHIFSVILICVFTIVGFGFDFKEVRKPQSFFPVSETCKRDTAITGLVKLDSSENTCRMFYGRCPHDHAAMGSSTGLNKQQTCTPVAHWSFDNPDDPGHDDTGNGHDAALQGNPTWVEGAFYFDGLDDYLEAFYSSADLAYIFNKYTVQVRIKYTSPTNVYLLNRGRSGGNYHTNFMLFVDSGVEGQIRGGHEMADDSSVMVETNAAYPVNDGNWHEIVITCDGSLLKIYRDGFLDDSRAAPPPGYQLGSYYPVVIGAAGEHNRPHDYFRGYIDCVKLYDCPVAPPLKVKALVDFDPDILNRKSRGRWVTAYITLPEGYDVNDIDITTMAITSLIGLSASSEYVQPADLGFIPRRGDRDQDGIPDLTVKFDRAALLPNLFLDDVTITIEGKLLTGACFSGSDTIRVIRQ